MYTLHFFLCNNIYIFIGEEGSIYLDPVLFLLFISTKNIVYPMKHSFISISIFFYTHIYIHICVYIHGLSGG